ncbi:MAG TPA: sulfite exporter TauE/SafE family protein [Nitrososphaeria archaeon]|nr:MAG: hypothetical protein DRN68_01070 [Nitrososphaerota archaeon]HDJ66798.1 sulfite exporter TauE/SafE family protein [Nitrososphaeria archaeon]
MEPWSIAAAALAIFATSSVFSMFGRGGGEFYLLIMLSMLSLTYYTCAGISLFLIMLQGLSMIIVYHGKHRFVDWGLAIILGLIVGVCSFLGGFLSYKVPAYLLKISFSTFLLISAYFIYKGIHVKPVKGKFGVWTRRLGEETYHVNMLYIMIPVAIAAFTAGMVGISGGGLIIPVCVLFGGVPIRIAMGTNTFLVLTSSTMSFAGHLIRGGFNPILGGVFGCVVILGAQIGSRFHVKIDERTLRKAFSLILVVAAIWMLVKIFL